VQTYSIVARDPATGQLGVAVQSKYFAVGPVAPWAQAGVGAVASQAFDGAEFGPEVLGLLADGRPAAQALAALLQDDPHRELRQVGVVDARGQVAVHTGRRCVAAAGHAVGEGFAVQANVMLDDSVWPAMKTAYEGATGDLADRMLQALAGGQAVGGDIRGQQSAALVVVAGEPGQRPWLGRLVDVRVDDHPQPVVELGRLLRLHRAHELLHEAKAALMAREAEDALARLGLAATLAADQIEIRLYLAVSLLEAGRESEAIPVFREVFAEEPRWAQLLPRLLPRGLVGRDPVAVARIAALGGPHTRRAERCDA
jgi:uncharacterized Ntn-hydrolase superfamily protein